MNIKNGVVFLGNDFVLSPFIVDPWRVKLPFDTYYPRNLCVFCILENPEARRRTKVVKLLSEETAQVAEVFYLYVKRDDFHTT